MLAADRRARRRPAGSTSPRSAGAPATWSGAGEAATQALSVGGRRSRRPRRRRRGPRPRSGGRTRRAGSPCGRWTASAAPSTRSSPACLASAVWPADAAEPPPTTATLFQQEPIAAPARRAGDGDSLVASTLRAQAIDPATSGPPPRSALTPGFWDVEGGAEPVAPELPDPAEELDAAARALAAGELDEAALRFALTLRLAPALAPAVIEATEGTLGTGGAAGSGPAGPALSVVRGDAFRLVGLELEARRAYAMAAWSGARDRRRRAAPASEPPAVSDTIPPVPRAGSRATTTRTPR